MKCYFCDQQFPDETPGPNGTIRIPRYNKCENHSSTVSMVAGRTGIIHQGFHVSLDPVIDNMKITWIESWDDKQDNNPMYMPHIHTIFSGEDPNITDFDKFIEFIDRILSLKVFS